MPNHLQNETSPYLRQHKDNPVNWYPWGDVAISEAREQHKPIFLSIGYAACHWCHVMAHESFEDPHVAKILNDHFISIKVDREERPDLDDIYMQAVVMITGQGGWPMSVFLTPELKPFFGSTYYPPLPRYGMPSFTQILISVIEIWNNNRESIESNAQVITESIQSQFNQQPAINKAIDFESIIDSLYQTYDWEYGGWDRAPKFPQGMLLQFLIQRATQSDHRASEIMTHVLDHMARGGLYDLVGGGFHRYSTDRHWLVPHFEKMLYDNALLSLAYLHSFALTGSPVFKQIAVDTLDFIQREMTHPLGGFFASLDADTPEGEGRYYTWQYSKLHQSLSAEQFDLLQAVMNLNPHGNFENGWMILQYKDSLDNLAEKLDLSTETLLYELQLIFKRLSEIRDESIPPAKDDKIITAWNALAIRTFFEAGLLLGRDDYTTSAENALNFLLSELITPNGQILRSWSKGKATIQGTLADYAGLILALHASYQTNFSPVTYAKMKEIFESMQVEFRSDDILYYDTSSNVPHLLFQHWNLQDSATPSGNALAAHVLWLMSHYEHDPRFDVCLQKMIDAVSQQASQFPVGFGYWLQVADLHDQSAQQIALVSDQGVETLQPLLDIYRHQYRPYSVIAAKFFSTHQDGEMPSLLSNHTTYKGNPTAFICQDFTCQRPTTDPEVFKQQLKTKSGKR